MKTNLVLGAAICALTQGAPVDDQTVNGAALQLASVQQAAALSGLTWGEQQQCLVLAQQLVARTGPQRSASIRHDDLKALSDEICAE